MNMEETLLECAAQTYRANIKLQNIEAELVGIQCFEIADACDEGAIKYYYRMAMHLEYMKFAMAMNAEDAFTKHHGNFIDQVENFNLACEDVYTFIRENA